MIEATALKMATTMAQAEAEDISAGQAASGMKLAEDGTLGGLPMMEERRALRTRRRRGSGMMQAGTQSGVAS